MTDTAKNTVSDERLAEMLAGLEGVTPGPYNLVVHPGQDEDEADDVILWSTGEDANIARLFSFQRAHGPMPDLINGKHFARCDPATMRSIITELQSLRASIPGGVGVKGLEWEHLGADHWRAAAPLFGYIRVENFGSGFMVNWSAPGITDTLVKGKWDSATEAKAAAQADYERRILAALDLSPAEHPDDLAVDRFAAAMKAKLAKKREEGRGGWEDKDQCTAAFLSQLLREHVEKGDPLDVGNLAMMLHQRGERLSPAEGEVDDGSERAAIEIADAVIAWMVRYDLLDADQEYRDDDIVAVLDELSPGLETTNDEAFASPLVAPSNPVISDDAAILALIREEAGKDNSPLGRSDTLALDRIRSILGVTAALSVKPQSGETK